MQPSNSKRGHILTYFNSLVRHRSYEIGRHRPLNFLALSLVVAVTAMLPPLMTTAALEPTLVVVVRPPQASAPMARMHMTATGPRVLMVFLKCAVASRRVLAHYALA